MKKDMKKTFIEFLQDKFMELREIGGVCITKDNYGDLFDSWLQGLDPEEWISLGKEALMA